jgi:Co/Zn/Cd efflux system component
MTSNSTAPRLWRRACASEHSAGVRDARVRRLPRYRCLCMTGPSVGVLHRHGHHVHIHPHDGQHRHVVLPHRSRPLAAPHTHGDVHGRGHAHDHGHGHSHGLADGSIVRSHEGVKAVAISLAVLGIAAGAQVAIFVLSGSVALLADLIHNFGDALTAVPLGIAFFLRSFRGEKLAGLAVVLVIFVSACVALYETIQRLIHPQDLSHLWILAVAGVIGFLGNEIAAQVRLRAGKRLSSPAMIADGNHARVDGFVSLGVVASAIVVSLGLQIGDPIIGIAITVVILRITWQSWRTVSATEPGEMIEPRDH